MYVPVGTQSGCQSLCSPAYGDLRVPRFRTNLHQQKKATKHSAIGPSFRTASR